MIFADFRFLIFQWCCSSSSFWAQQSQFAGFSGNQPQKSHAGVFCEQRSLLDEEIHLFGETDQFVRNCEHCGAASHGCGIFWSLPRCSPSHTSSCPQVHTCSSWNADCTSNTLLRRCGSMFGFRSSDSLLDADWCCDDSLTAPLFARLRQLLSFKQRLLSHLEHCPNSMDSATNTPTPSKDSCCCC